MAFLIGYGKAAVCGLGAGVGTVATGGAAIYGGVTGDYRAADGFARATRDLGGEALHGLEDAGRGIVDTGRGALTVLDVANPAGNYNPMFSYPNLTGYAWVCAKVSYIVYEEQDGRPSSFTDEEGCQWTEIPPDKIPIQHDTKYHTVYQNGDTIIIGIRGTDFNDAGDYASDAAIVLGAIPPFRNTAAEEFACSMHRSGRYGTIYLTGHSLGGCIASYVGLSSGCGFRVHCFNPGAAPHDKIASFLVYASRHCDGFVTVHRISTDLISAFVSSSRRVIVHSYKKRHNGLAHGIHQFL